MKIELTAGCTLDSLLVNGRRFETLPYDEIRNVITILLDYYKDTDLCMIFYEILYIQRVSLRMVIPVSSVEIL